MGKGGLYRTVLLCAAILGLIISGLGPLPAQGAQGVPVCTAQGLVYIDLATGLPVSQDPETSTCGACLMGCCGGGLTKPLLLPLPTIAEVSQSLLLAQACSTVGGKASTEARAPPA